MEQRREDEYLTIRQAAKYLTIPEPVLRLTIRCGKKPAQRAGRGNSPVVRKDDLRVFLDPLGEGRERGPVADRRAGKATANPTAEGLAHEKRVERGQGKPRHAATGSGAREEQGRTGRRGKDVA